VNVAPMAAGATLFPGDVIRLGEASTVALQFGNSLVLAAPETELVVESEGVSLPNGLLQVRAGGAESFAVSGTFFDMDIAAYGGIPSSAEIRLEGMRAQVSAVVCAADLTASGRDACQNSAVFAARRSCWSCLDTTSQYPALALQAGHVFARVFPTFFR
jgi:hypothetical protein